MDTMQQEESFEFDLVEVGAATALTKGQWTGLFVEESGQAWRT